MENKPDLKVRKAIFGAAISIGKILTEEGPKIIQGIDKDGIDLIWRVKWYDNHNATNWTLLSKAQLIVKPIEKISVPDCREVFKVWVGDYIENLDPKKHPYGYSGKDKNKIAAYIIKDELFDEDLTELAQPLIDILRELGYVLPYKNWSVEQLVEAGIYKLIDK